LKSNFYQKVYFLLLVHSFFFTPSSIHLYSHFRLKFFYNANMSSRSRPEPRAIIIGCGVAGIALSARLKTQLGFNNFEVFEREKSIGGTWYLNTYPGVGCDVDSHLYSFSFNLNPNWSKRFAEQEEILGYLNDTVDKFGIRPHVTTGVEVVGATWIEKKWVWQVELRTLETGHIFVREAEILVSCVGTISIPADITIFNHEKFNGTTMALSSMESQIQPERENCGSCW
jgi:cation diffusion facilitator CzcD-associated flavoprotein CzcO